MSQTFHPLSAAAILALVAVAACAAVPPMAAAQGHPDTARHPTLDSPSSPAEPSPEGNIGSALERFSSWKARMKAEHFSAYLAAHTALLGAVTGLIFGFIGYRLSDPMSFYRLVRRRILQLTAAIGFSLGIIAAVMQVPHNAAEKVFLLAVATGVGAATAFIGGAIAFLMMRLLANRAARRDGRRLTDRMRHR